MEDKNSERNMVLMREVRTDAMTTAVFMTLSLIMIIFSTSLFAAEWEPQDALQIFLEDNYPWEKIEVSNVQTADDVPDMMPETIIVDKGPVGKGVFSFIFEDGQKITITADVRALSPVIRSKRPFKKGYVLGSDDVYETEMDINRMPKNSVKDTQGVIGKQLRRSVIADMVIVEDMIQKNKVIKRGKRVLLMYSSDGLNVTAIGETKEKGFVGMQVRAVNLSSKKEVRGVLIDEDTVRIEL